MHVRLKRTKYVEIQGVLTKCVAGDCVKVGKMTGLQWISAGEADYYTPNVDLLAHFLQDNSSGAKFSLFCCPMSFEGRVKIWQENALTTWRKMVPAPEIIMCYDDPGVEEYAKGAGFRHTNNLRRNERGTPLISELFKAGQEQANRDIVSYVNSDVMVIGMGRAIQAAKDWFGREPFLLIGRRWDLDIFSNYQFDNDWKKNLQRQVCTTGHFHGPDAIDWFAFPKGLYQSIPDFAIGRSAWDNWLVLDALLRGVNVVDCTFTVGIVHQEKPKGNEDKRISAERLAEKRKNRAMYDARVADGIEQTGRRVKGITNEAPWVMICGEIKER